MVPENCSPTQRTFEVLKIASPHRGTLNTEFLTLLEAGGIQFDDIIHILDALIDTCVKGDFLSKALSSASVGYTDSPLSRFKQLVSASVDRSDPYYTVLASEILNQHLNEVRSAFRIPVAASNNLTGVYDWSGTLADGEVFFVDPSIPFIEDGTYILVGKNPCHHPGDLAKFKYKSVPLLMSVPGVLFFPIVGEGSATASMSGSDLDGDIFWTCYDPKIVNKYQPSERATYISHNAKNDLEFPVSIDKVKMALSEELSDYSLGIIGSLHQVVSDLFGAKHPVALNLAEDFFHAVDASKTGWKWDNTERKYDSYIYHAGLKLTPNYQYLRKYLEGEAPSRTFIYESKSLAGTISSYISDQAQINLTSTLKAVDSMFTLTKPKIIGTNFIDVSETQRNILIDVVSQHVNEWITKTQLVTQSAKSIMAGLANITTSLRKFLNFSESNTRRSYEEMYQVMQYIHYVCYSKAQRIVDERKCIPLKVPVRGSFSPQHQNGISKSLITSIATPTNVKAVAAPKCDLTALPATAKPGLSFDFTYSYMQKSVSLLGLSRKERAKLKTVLNLDVLPASFALTKVRRDLLVKYLESLNNDTADELIKRLPFASSPSNIVARFPIEKWTPETDFTTTLGLRCIYSIPWRVCTPLMCGLYQLENAKSVYDLRFASCDAFTSFHINTKQLKLEVDLADPDIEPIEMKIPDEQQIDTLIDNDDEI